MEYFKKLIGDRIYLSPKSCSLEEAEKYTEWLNDFKVTDYIDKTSSLISLPLEKDWISNSIKDNSARVFNIVTLDGDKLIGTISLEQIKWVDRSAVLGIFIGDGDYLNNEYGTEAIRLLLEYGFRYLNLHVIKLELIDCNERAHRCYLKCGFKDVGRNREMLFVNGKYHDLLHMDILEDEFDGDYIKNKVI